MSLKYSTPAELSELYSKSEKAAGRLTLLFDDGKFTEVGRYVKNGDALSGVVTAFGYVDGVPVYAFSQDTSARYGALTRQGAEKISRLYTLAAETGAPVVGVYDSFGADLEDALGALSAYGELLSKSANISGVVPTISVVCGVCSGAAAMLAVNADIVIAVKDSELYISPNSGIKDLAANNAKTGVTALTADDDAQAFAAVKSILGRVPQNNLAPAPMYEFEEPAAAFGSDAVSQAEAVFDAGSVKELYAEYGTNAYTALASVGGNCVGVLATNKAGGKLTGDDASKLARFIRLLDSFNIPAVTLVDTEGFVTDSDAEAAGAVKAMAKLSHAYSEATNAKISVVTGKAYGSAFISLSGKGANADMTIALDSAVISALDPLTAVEFLSHDRLAGASDLAAARKELADEFVKSECTAYAAAQSGAVDAVVSSGELRAAILEAVEMMSGKRAQRLPKKHSNIQL